MRLSKSLMKRLLSYLIIIIVICELSYGFISYSQNIVDTKVLNNLYVHVEALSNQIGVRNYSNYDNLQKAEEYISNQLEDIGYKLISQSFIINEKKFTNVIAVKQEFNPSKPTLIIGAHYDSCFNPGADDNASGVAGMLELARLLRQKQLDLQIKFIAFVNEEPPFFQTDNMGSFVYAKTAKKNNENIYGAIVLEMIGFYSDEKNSQRYPPLLGLFYPNRGNFISVIGNRQSKSIVKQFLKTTRKENLINIKSLIAPNSMPAINFSDHWSFWKQGYKAVMITDTAYLRNSNYHKNTDTYLTLNYDKMSGVVYSVKQVILDIDNKLKIKRK